MKFRRITIFGLTLALAGTLTAFAACTDPENTGETPPEYTFEDGRPDGDLAAPDEGFEIDGVLDESAYANLNGLEGPVLRPYYTSDGQGIYYDYDVIQEKTASAGQVKMGTYYGENGVYIAYSYKEQAGKVCYVNPTRRSYRNSGVELHIGIPASLTMTGDETISRLTVNANGALTIAKTQGDTWMAPFGTVAEENMPYVGLTGNGTRTDENADRTEYTFELFIPWGYFDEVGGAGTAEGMKEGGDLVVAPGIITANNYTGTGQTDREYYVLSARLDDGSWQSAQGWYHFNKNGVVGYDITIAQPQNGSVQEWMGYDTAAKNSSLTFVTKANDGYALKEFRVNGVAVPSDYIHYDMYTTLGADAESNVQKAYIKIPEKEITGDVSVEAVFEPLASGEQTLVATVCGESTENPLANATVTFTRGDEVKTATTDENGTFTLSGLTAGLYDVAVNDLTYRKLTDYVFFSPKANAQIVFELNEFALEGSGNIASNYSEIQGNVGSLEGGFVFSGFFGFEGAEFDDLTTFTATVNFRLEDGAQYGFRFTKWNQYVVLKCQQREWSFADNSAAMAYMREQGGVYFMFAVDPDGEQDNGISVYIKQDANTWVQLALSGGSGDYAFPFDKEVTSINFGKQDDSNTAHYAVLEGGELQIGTSDVDIPVIVTVNGGEQVIGGEVAVTESVSLGETITVTLTPEDSYELSALEVDGKAVSCTEQNGVYTYTFTATKSSYALTVTFGELHELTVTVNTSAMPSAENDIAVTLTDAAGDEIELQGSGSTLTAQIPYGAYTVTVTSKEDGYTVLEQKVTFAEGSAQTTVNITADNYGANRKYTLEGSATEDGVVLVENLGATTNGFVFEGFLGVGGSGSLADIGDKNYATALRFTTESGYQYRVCFYIWNGKYWLIKVFEEGKENSAQSHEFGFSDNTALINYVKGQNGITVNIGVDNEGNFSVYAMTSATEWISLGSWKMIEYEHGKIEKVELLRMFTSGVEDWTATVDGELKFGTTDTGIDVSFTGTGSVTGGLIDVTDAHLGDKVTVTLTPDELYVFSSLSVDGTSVECTAGAGGVYTYTFTATKSSYAFAAVFEQAGGAYTVNATIAETLTGAANDLRIVLSNGSSEYVATKGTGNVWTTESIPYGKYTVIVTSVSDGYTVLEQEVTFAEGSAQTTVNITADNYGANRKYTLEGSENVNSRYSEIQGKVGSLEGGFVFSGFFGFEGATYDELGRFTNTVFFDMADGSQGAFRFTKWDDLLMLKYGSEEYRFQGDAEAVEYFKAESGVYFMFVVDGSGNVSSYIKRSADEWTCLSTSSSAKFPIGQTLNAIRFGKQDDDTERYAVLKGGVLQLGTTDTGIAVSFTGTDSVTGGSIDVTDAHLGDEVTVTLTPDEGYAVSSLSVDGQLVECTAGEDGVYTYTFTTMKSNYTLTAAFGESHAFTVTVDTSAVPNAAGDLEIELTNGSVRYVATAGEGVWTANIPYGEYTLIVSSASGEYMMLTEGVTFADGSASTEIVLTADNYGANRKYTLEGESATEDGVVLVENLGATTNGFVFEGFLGVGGTGNLSEIGSKSFASALRFTTESGYQFRVCFYIWKGNGWLIKAFEEGKENQSGFSNEFGFSGNTTLIDYIKAENGITVSIAAAVDGTLTVYAKTSDTEWISLGTWQSPFEIDEKITQVEVLRMFTSGVEDWTATVNGELKFGTTDTGVTIG